MCPPSRQLARERQRGPGSLQILTVFPLLSWERPTCAETETARSGKEPAPCQEVLDHVIFGQVLALPDPMLPAARPSSRQGQVTGRVPRPHPCSAQVVQAAFVVQNPFRRWSLWRGRFRMGKKGSHFSGFRSVLNLVELLCRVYFPLSLLFLKPVCVGWETPKPGSSLSRFIL